MKSVFVLACISTLALAAASSEFGVSFHKEDNVHDNEIVIMDFENGAMAYDELPVIKGIRDSMGWTYDSVNEEFKHGVVDFNYEEENIYEDSRTRTIYKYPDEMFVRDTPEMHEFESNEIYHSVDQMIHEEASYSFFGFSLWFPFVSLDFSFSKSKGYLSDLFKADRRQLAKGERTTGFYEAELYPNPPFNIRFQNAIDNLPENFETEDEQREYAQFIAHFGTHLCNQAMFGGVVNYSIAYDSVLTKVHNEEWVQHQIGIGLKLMRMSLGLEAKTGESDLKKEYHKDFIEHAKNVSDSAGGSISIEVSGNYTDWVNSVVDNPTAIPKKSRFIPLSEFVGRSKKKAMETAITWYNARGNLDFGNQLTDSTPPHLALRNEAVDPSTLPPIHGLDAAGCGFDGATFEHRFPVLQWTYDDDPYCTDCTYEIPGYPDYVYKVPNELIVQNTPESELKNDTYVFRDVVDYERYTEETHKSGGFLGFGKKKKTTIDYYHMYYEHDEAMSETYRYYAWYTLTIPTLPKPQVNKRFLRAWQALPEEYSPEDYAVFTRTYGTHYLTKAIMGGHLNATTYFHKCFLQEYSYHFVQSQSSWSFIGIIHGGHGSHSKDEHVTEQFWQYSSTNVTLYGGFTDKYQPEDYKEWVQTIKLKPRPVAFEMKPIWGLIENPKIAENVERHAREYMARADAEAKALAEELAKHDPRIAPDWCHHPDVGRR